MPLRQLEYMPAHNTVLFPSVRDVHHLGFPAGCALPHQQGAGWEAGQVQLYASSNASIQSCCTESTQPRSIRKGPCTLRLPSPSGSQQVSKVHEEICAFGSTSQEVSLFLICVVD